MREGPESRNGCLSGSSPALTTLLLTLSTLITIKHMKDKCVMCGAETPYEFETHIDYRIGYVEGAGQTCPNGCPSVSIPHKTILDTPNDFDLGELVRKLFYKNHKS
jgi:hypothetical protein